MKKTKNKIRKRINKKIYRYPHNIYFMTDDDIFCYCTQIRKAFLCKRKMNNYLRSLRKENYISPQGYDMLSKCCHWQEGCTVFITGKLKLRKHDITRLYHLSVSQNNSSILTSKE